MSTASDTVVPASTATSGSTAETARRLRVALARLGRWMARAHPDASVTPTRLVAMGVLELIGPMRIGALADHLGASAPTTSRLVECLHEHGFVARTPDPDDHRATRVGLTSTGLARLHEQRTLTTDDLARRIEALAAADHVLLVAALPVLEELARRDAPRP